MVGLGCNAGVAGETGRLAQQAKTALSMIEGDAFDAAILDTNLAGVSAGPAATALRASGRPFVVVSGYLPSQQHEVFRSAPCIQKPYAPQRLIEFLWEILPLYRTARTGQSFGIAMSERK